MIYSECKVVGDPSLLFCFVSCLPPLTHTFLHIKEKVYGELTSLQRLGEGAVPSTLRVDSISPSPSTSRCPLSLSPSRLLPSPSFIGAARDKLAPFWSFPGVGGGGGAEGWAEARHWARDRDPTRVSAGGEGFVGEWDEVLFIYVVSYLWCSMGIVLQAVGMLRDTLPEFAVRAQRRIGSVLPPLPSPPLLACPPARYSNSPPLSFCFSDRTDCLSLSPWTPCPGSLTKSSLDSAGSHGARWLWLQCVCKRERLNISVWLIGLLYPLKGEFAGFQWPVFPLELDVFALLHICIQPSFRQKYHRFHLK